MDGGPNTYSYVANNPIGLIDPLGLIPPAAGAGGGAATGGLGGLGGFNGSRGIDTSAPFWPKWIRDLFFNEDGNDPPDTPIDPPSDNPQQCDDREERCDQQYYGVDIPTCRGISRSRGPVAAERCYASAAERYAACLRGRPIPPLDTYNN